jgi:signal transduction histidine kinase
LSQPDFQPLFQSAPGLYLVLSPALTIVAASDAFLQATTTARADLVGRDFFAVFPAGPAGATLRASLERVLEQRRPDALSVQGRDVGWPGPEDRHLRLLNNPVLAPDGSVAYVVHCVEDVTELFRLRLAEGRLTGELEARNASLERLASRLWAANAELDTFSHSIAHDLRAPLRHIDGFAQAVLEEELDRLSPEGVRHLRLVRSSSQRLSRLIDDLLGLSRLTRAELRHQVVDLSAMSQEILTELRSADPGREVETVIEPGLRVLGDARLLRVALENLLGNAWKFTAGQPRAHIEVGREHGAGEGAFYVRDDGVGFDMTYADQLFGAFQRLHAAGEFEGTGVGLAAVRRVITRHGGRIWAVGAVGQGATFSFTLPLAG